MQSSWQPGSALVLNQRLIAHEGEIHRTPDDLAAHDRVGIGEGRDDDQIQRIQGGKHAKAEAESDLKSDFILRSPLLWTIEKPVLYRAEFPLTCGEKVLDEHVVRFGIRSAVFDEEDGFVLNGKKTKLWGVNLHHDGGAVGAAVPIEVWQRRLKVLKGLGVNTIRASHNPMAEEMYDLCDEMGFLVVDELYDKWIGSSMYFDALYEEWHEADLDAMIRRDANHPCVVLWSVGNEVRGQYSEQFFRCLEEMCALTRQKDPTRAVTAALIMFVLPEYNDTTPLGKRLAVARRYAQAHSGH